MACRITRKEDGTIDQVLAPNGKPSRLYNDLLDLIKENPGLGENDPYVQKVLGENLIKSSAPEEIALAMWSKVYTPAFKDWFGDSKVVDEYGEPRLVYHGSEYYGFSSFEPSMLGATTQAPSARKGFFFASNIEVSEQYLFNQYNDLYNDIYEHYKINVEEFPELDLSEGGVDWEAVDKERIYNEEADKVYKILTLETLLEKGDISKDEYTRELEGITKEKRRERNLRFLYRESFLAKNRSILEGFPIDEYGIYYDPKSGQPLVRLTPKQLRQAIVDRLSDPSDPDRIEISNIIEKDLVQERKALRSLIYPVFLSIQDPKVVDFKFKSRKSVGSYADFIASAKIERKDGAVFENTFDPEKTDIYVSFSPNQIKSAFNTGEFSESTNNIYYQLKNEARESKKDIVAELAPVLDKYGIKLTAIQHYAEITGRTFDEAIIALADPFRKMIAIAKGKEDSTTLPEELAHIVIENSVDTYELERLLKYVESTQEYTTNADEYRDRYKADDPNASDGAIEIKVKKEILGKLLGRHILKKIERKGDNALMRMLRRIWEQFKSLFTGDVSELERHLDRMAEDVLDVGKPAVTNVKVRGALYVEEPNIDIVVDDRVVGNIKLRSSGGELRVRTINAPSEIAETALTELGELAHVNGIKLVSDNKRSGLAYNTWKNLEKAGKAERTKKGGVRFHYVPVGVYYHIEEGTRKIIDDFIISLEARTKRLSKRGVSNVNVRAQRRALSREAKAGYTALGIMKFIRLLKEDSNDAIAYIQEITKDSRLYEYFTDPNINPQRLETLRKEIEGQKITAKKIAQLHEFVSYYEPYLVDLEAYIGLREDRLTNLKRRGLLKAVRQELEKFRQIRAFKDNVREQVTENIFRETYAEELKLDPNDPNLDDAITEKLGFDWKSELYEFHKDSPKLEFWFGSLRDASDQILRAIHSMVVRIKQVTHRATIDFGREMIEKARELGVSRESFNWAYEREDGKYTGYFISPWIVSKFEKAKEEFHKNLHEEFEYPDNFEDRLDLKDEIREWDKKQHEEETITPEQQAAVDKFRRYNKRIARWYFANTYPVDNLNEVIAERKKTLTKEQYKDWYRKSVGRSYSENGESFLYYKGDLVRPSTGQTRTSLYDGSRVKTTNYSNPDWKKLTQNQKDFLEWVLRKKFELDNSLPVYTRATKAPQITESFMDIIHNQKGDMLRHIGLNIAEGVRIKEEDYLQGEEPERRPDGSIVRYVPIRFVKSMENPHLISTDLMSGMVAYFEMVENFKRMSDKVPEFELIQQQIGARVLHHKKRGKTPTTGTQTTTYQMLDKFLEMNVSEMRKADLEVAGFNLTATLQKFAQYVRANNLAWNVATQFTNLMSSAGFSLIEDIVGQYTTVKSKAWAHKEMWKHLPKIFSDVANPMTDDKLLLLMRHAGISYSTRELFDNLDKSRIKNLMTDAGMYKGYQLGDFIVKSKVMLAAMHNYREYEGRFYEKREFDALETGIDFYTLPSSYDKITVKDGKLRFDIPEVTVNQLFSRIEYISNVVDGRLSSADYAAVHQHAIFSLVAIHRNWLFSGIQRRFRKRGFNFMTGQTEEGHYNVIGRKVFSVGRMLKAMYFNEATMEDLRSMLANGWSNMDNIERLAVKRVITEMVFAVLAAGIAVILNKLSDDEDDYTLDLAAYLSNRVAIEMSSFQNPQEFITVIKDPFVPLRLIEYSFDFTDVLDGSEIERGPWEGWSKRERFFMRLFPGVKAVQTMSDPGSANQFLKTKPLKQLYNLVEE